MSGNVIGAYGKGELRYEIEHNGVVLAELMSVDFNVKDSVEPAGEGVGILKNYYYKHTAAPKGGGKISRSYFTRGDNGKLFSDLLTGSRLFIQEPLASALATYTVGLTVNLVSILEVRLLTSQVVLREGIDFTVNYVTGVITFAVVTPEVGVIKYLAANRKGSQFIYNSGFEDVLGSTWTAVATATLARNNTAANVFTESWALAVTPSAANDGVQYNVSTNLVPGRNYRLMIRAKAAAAETLQGKWYDGTTLQTMTGGPATLTATYALYEQTFVASKAVIPYLQIIDTKVSPGLHYIDEVKLIDDTFTAVAGPPTWASNPMDAGLAVPFQFNILERRINDGTVVGRLNKCVVDQWSVKSGKLFSEDVNFQFLEYIGE